MKTYGFYGWQTADCKDKNGLTPRDYYDLLSGIWSAETCAPRMRGEWSRDNKTRGQCSVTAFLIQELFGGKVYGVPLKDGNYHCFNDVDGCVFDLTSEQFGNVRLNYDDCSEQFRAAHFSKDEKRQRYELLKARLSEITPVIRPMRMENLPRYGEIYAEAFAGEPWNDPWERKDAEIHIGELLESKQAYGLEYLTDGEVAGFILGTSMLFHYGRTFEINDLAVAPVYQRQGIARRLLTHCIADVKAQGMVAIHLITAGKGALPKFYEDFGFGRETEVILMGLEC
ncbi:N-acetyltransferase [uncultured Ruminococcus sp.]|uniref:GNAT family N-acetyltransferase n=1 Tax=uncultured Ruminococcus sp. TaxID=165186 RepID=UPI00292EF747|nr:N-acetyltransferase [uncultured Ruminococcus sp.]